MEDLNNKSTPNYLLSRGASLLMSSFLFHRQCMQLKWNWVNPWIEYETRGTVFRSVPLGGERVQFEARGCVGTGLSLNKVSQWEWNKENQKYLMMVGLWKFNNWHLRVEQDQNWCEEFEHETSFSLGTSPKRSGPAGWKRMGKHSYAEVRIEVQMLVFEGFF